MIAETHQVPYGERQIEFQLIRRDRKTLSISVTPDLGIEVAAPQDTALEKICEKVRRRAPWITRQLLFFEQFQPRTPARRYVSGETHLYLGRQYKLKVEKHIRQEVKLYRGRLIVQTHRPKQCKLTKELVENWYRDRAHLKFRERVALCRDLFPRPDAFEPRSIMVRQMRQRWGSMTPSGTLVLNSALIRSSVDAIDYVITHELCHMHYAHHGPAFYKLLDRVMPDWEKRKIKLERQLI